MRVRSFRTSPAIAAALSFVLPGLGQAAAGRLRRAVLFSIPAIAALAVLLWFVLFDRHEIVDAQFNPDWLTAFLVLDLLALAYHAWAIVDAYRAAGGTLRPALVRGRVSWFAPAIVAILLVTTVGVHGFVAATDVQAQDDLSCIFNPDGPVCMFAADATEPPEETEPPDETAPAEETPTPSPVTSWLPQWTVVPRGPSAPPTPVPTPTPKPTPKPNQPVLPIYPVEPMPPSTGTSTDWAKDGRLNLLIVGSDAGSGRWSLRTDTMILLTVDLATGRAAMFGVPRNLYNVPLPPESAAAFPCHCYPYPYLLNSLYRYAMDNPKYFPGGSVRGFRALEGAIGQMAGVHVDGSVVVNLMGFVKLVDALGGIDINVPYRVVDSQYPLEDGSGDIAIDIKAGFHHFNGHWALAYARSRHQDSDYGRMQRQQLVLLAMRKTIAHPCSLAPKISSILGAIKGTFWTDMPISAASKLLNVAEHVGASNAATFTFTPPAYPEWLDNSVVAKIRNTVAHGLDHVSGGGGSSGGGGC